MSCHSDNSYTFLNLKPAFPGFKSAVRNALARLGAEISTFEVLLVGLSPEPAGKPSLAGRPGFCWSPLSGLTHPCIAPLAKAVTMLDREGRTLTSFQPDSPPA